MVKDMQESLKKSTERVNFHKKGGVLKHHLRILSQGNRFRSFSSDEWHTSWYLWTIQPSRPRRPLGVPRVRSSGTRDRSSSPTQSHESNAEKATSGSEAQLTSGTCESPKAPRFRACNGETSSLRLSQGPICEQLWSPAACEAPSLP